MKGGDITDELETFYLTDDDIGIAETALRYYIEHGNWDSEQLELAKTTQRKLECVLLGLPMPE